MFEDSYKKQLAKYEEMIRKKNYISDEYNGIYDRWVNPVLTRDHAPLFWVYDMNKETNPDLTI